MAGPPIEFGKRRPTALPDTPQPKRSNHVALLVMGTLAVGSGAYALMQRENCQPPSPGMAGPALPQNGAAATACTSRGSFSGGGGGYSRSHFSFFGGSSSSSGGSDSASSGVSRGGFGSFAHAFGFSGRS